MIKRGDDRGAVAVEFAILFPMLLFVVLTALQLGQFLATQSELTSIAGRASRALEINPDMDVATLRTTLSQHMVFLSDNDLSISTGSQMVAGQSMRRLDMSYLYGGYAYPLPLENITFTEVVLAP